MITVYVRYVRSDDSIYFGNFAPTQLKELVDSFKEFPIRAMEYEEGYDAEFADASYIVDDTGTHFEIVVRDKQT